MKLKIEKVSNMIMISEVNTDTVYKAWDAEDVTERKIRNAVKSITSCYAEYIEVFDMR